MFATLSKYYMIYLDLFGVNNQINIQLAYFRNTHEYIRGAQYFMTDMWWESIYQIIKNIFIPPKI